MERHSKQPVSCKAGAVFTLIELLVTTAQQNCFSKIKKYTSLRPTDVTPKIWTG